MHEITIPQPAKLPTNDGRVVEYHFGAYLAEWVWSHEYWRSSPELLLLMSQTQPKFDGAKPGDKVRLTDRQYAKLLPRALMQGDKLPPHLMAPLTPFMLAVAQAEEVEEADGDG